MIEKLNNNINGKGLVEEVVEKKQKIIKFVKVVLICEVSKNFFLLIDF